MTLSSATRKREWFCQRFDRFGNRCNALCPANETECDAHYEGTAPDPAPPARPALHGFQSRVYFIRAESLGLVKIGTAKDIEKRMGGLRGACPVPIALLGSIVGGVQVERWLHFHCYADREHYEWFRWTTRVQAIVDRVLSHGEHAATTMCRRHLEADRALARKMPGAVHLGALPSARCSHEDSEGAYLENMSRVVTPLDACACSLCGGVQ